jgi:signal transduction histidine kinase
MRLLRSWTGFESMQVEMAQVMRHPCVMLVEDDLGSGEALAQLLDSNGYEVDRCTDGHEALRHLRRGTRPDVILLDLMMPNLNGWEFRVEQRRDPEWAAIPVIVLSADQSAQASAIDADGYLRKPIDPSALLAFVERVLHMRERHGSDARSAELDRMNSLGVVAAGLAQEINDPLACVAGNLELTQKQCSQLDGQVPATAQEDVRALARLLGHAQLGAERIADVVRKVATFARPNTEQVVPMNVQEVLESSLQLMGNEIRHHARLERDYAPVPPVMGNPAKLGQVFTNLMINAVHALGEADAAHNQIRVATRAGADAQVIISISDSGSGIPPEVVGRIFDPFFSTKAIGAGMGLGLAICQRLVSNMGGKIRVDTAPGRGATFTVVLPGSVQNTADHRNSQVAQTPPSEKRASVLIIDDEAMMIDLLNSMLQDEYQVTAFPSSRQALECLLTERFFDVILCDLMMPDLNGMDLYAEVLKERPEQAARFVFMTGGAFTDRASEFLDSIDSPPLNKPFRNDELHAIVAAHLARFEPPNNPQGSSRTYS